MSSAWLWAVKRYTDKRLFASRDILAEEDEIQPNGKLFRKLGMYSDILTMISTMILTVILTPILFRPGRLPVDDLRGGRQSG